MQTTMNPNAGLPRREALERSHAYLAAILIWLFALGGMAGEPAQEQTLSAASTWRLPRGLKAVCFALSPDGDSLALMRTNGEVEIWSTLTHEPIRKMAAESKPADMFSTRALRALLFSPDGLWLAVLSGGPLWLIPAAGGTNDFLIGEPRESVSRASFSGDGRRLLVAGRTERVVSLPEGKPIGVFQAQSPGLAGRPVLRPLSRHGKPPRPIRSWVCALSPDGSEVALGQQFYEVERWDVATGDCRAFVKLSAATMLSSGQVVSALNYAPSGGQLVAVLNGDQWDVALAEPDGTWRTLLHQTPLGQKQTDHRRAIKDAFFAPGGKEIVLVAEKLLLGNYPMEMLGAKSVGPEVQFLDVATGAVTRRLGGTNACFFSQAWVAADGRRLMVIQRTYAIVPRSHAERQAQHLHEADAPAALLTVPLERLSATNSP